MAVSTQSHPGPSYHNLAAATYVFASLLLLEAPQRLPFWIRAIGSAGAFSCGAFTNSITVALLPLFGMVALYAIPRPWRWFYLPVQLGSLCFGVVLCTAILGELNALLGGPFWFFSELVQASINVLQHKVGNFSRMTLEDFLHVWRYPWLLLPTLALVSAVVILPLRIIHKRFDMVAALATCTVVTLATACLLQYRNQGTLQFPHLFSMFMVPTWLMLGATLGTGYSRSNSPARVEPFLSLGWMAGVGILMTAPLSIFGRDFALLQQTLEKQHHVLANGFIVACAVFMVMSGASCILRGTPQIGALLGALALGIMNPLCPGIDQPAHLYDYRTPCSFRRDAFSAIVQVDQILSEFDPNNRAYWVFPTAPREEPLFNGRDWCSILPTSTVARAVTLTRYFYTTKQFTNGYHLGHPMEKLTLTAENEAHADLLFAQFRAGHSPQLQYTQAFSHVMALPTFSIVVRGYTVTATKPL